MNALAMPGAVEVVSTVYDAALDSARWPATVAALTSWMGGEVGCLQVRRLSPALGVSMIATGVDPAFESAYREYYFQLDPHLSRVGQLVGGRTMLSREVLPDDELFRTAYFNEFCRPQRLCDLQGAMLIRDPSRVVTFAVYGSDRRRFDELTRARLDAVVPHLTRSVKLALRAEELESACASMDARQEGRTGLLRVNEALVLVCQPQSALGWLSEYPGRLFLVDGRLVTRERHDEDTLRACVRSALAGVPVSTVLDTGPWETVSVAVSRATESLMHPEPTAFIFLSIHGDARPGTQAAAWRDALPPALRPVADSLALGLSDKEIANGLNIPFATARTYVSRVLRKLGVKNRRELMGRPIV